MLPTPLSGIGALQLPLLPPEASGPHPTVPGSFNRLYDLKIVGESVYPAYRRAMRALMLAAPIVVSTEMSIPTPTKK